MAIKKRYQRYIAKTKINTESAIRIMINESEDGVFVFGYDTMVDNSSNWDSFYSNFDQAKEFIQEDYGINENDLIELELEENGCQQDWIENVILKRENNTTYLYSKKTGLLIDYTVRKSNINEGTINEMLLLTGLFYEFDKSIKTDKEKSRKILEYINLDFESIKKII